MRTGKENGNFSVHAIAGTHVITLAFDFKEKEDAKGLLGFAIHRTKLDKDGKDISKGGDWAKGYKPFEKIIDDPQPGVTYPTNEHPWQSFIWADYAVEYYCKYRYRVIAMYGKPGALEEGNSIEITVTPEPLKDKKHEIYFNRGVAASQAYAVRFGNLPPNHKSLTEKESQERIDWLSRGLFEALIDFIKQAKGAGWGLRAALYELDYLPAMQAFREVEKDGANVKIVYESRKGETQTPDNEETLKGAGFKINDCKTTFARKSSDGIPHNKFIVLLKEGKPLKVWTGSTNISRGGIFGHSNVGHSINDADIAAEYLKYWNILSQDLDKDKTKEEVEKEWPVTYPYDFPTDKMSVSFSPRKGNKMLDAYAQLLGNAKYLSIITLPFNIDKRFRAVLTPNSLASRYLLLNSGKTTKADLKKLEEDPDVIVAPGATIESDWGQWLAEKLTGWNGSTVPYIHTKYLIKDPLGPEPLIITGSANFSENSTSSNDENLVIIPCSNKKGETRVQDIYLGEFFRLFDHWYFRYLNSIDPAGKTEKAKKRFLKTSATAWINSYYDKKTDQYKRRTYFSWLFTDK